MQVQDDYHFRDAGYQLWNRISSLKAQVLKKNLE
jgi:hypothetical protein